LAKAAVPRPEAGQAVPRLREGCRAGAKQREKRTLLALLMARVRHLRLGGPLLHSLLKRRCREGVAALGLTALETDAEPAHALGRGAMGERVRHHRPASLMLQPV